MNIERYIGPWAKISDTVYRREFLIRGTVSIVYMPRKGWHRLANWNKFFALKEDAMNYVDQSLLKSNYVLLSQEDFDKLKILL